MCVLAFAWNPAPHWRLVAAGNRDEFQSRASAPLDRWEEGGVIAGRDLVGGGTWMGVSDAGRFAAVTNVRNPAGPDPALASRGALVADLLRAKGAFSDPQTVDPADFNPFNLIAVDGARARFLTNRPGPDRRDLAPGIYALANGGFDSPWPKSVRLKAALADWVASGDAAHEPLFAALADADAPPGVPGRDGVPADAPDNPVQAAIFIRNATYGTRCSTVVAVDADGKGRIAERRFNSVGAPAGESVFDFAWPV